MAKRAPKGTPTETNIYALRELFNNGAVTSVANQLAATDVPHIKRCLRAPAGALVEVTDGGKTLTLTAAGVAAIA